jgi:hypothetical protein
MSINVTKSKTNAPTSKMNYLGTYGDANDYKNNHICGFDTILNKKVDETTHNHITIKN